MRARRRVGVAASTVIAAVVAAVALAGCGVPVQRQPVAIPAGQLPAALAAQSTTTTIQGSSTPVSLVQVYFVAGDRLVARSRLVPSPGGLPEVLGDLLAGPTPAESTAGIRTSISPDTDLLSERVVRSRVILDLSASFTDTGGPDQILAVAQLVYTVTGTSGSADEVSFELGGDPVSVPSANGTLLSGPVDRSDYASLVSPSALPNSAGPH